MRKIREKLKSQSGASILIALLFFLVCAMVGASVLMAAASNAGKSRSNREEEQKYLTLSSAMQLVCDELTAAEYTAQFNALEREPVYKVGEIDDYGDPVIDHFIYPYEQKQGNYTNGFPREVLPLLNALDGVSASQLNLPQKFEYNGDEYHYKKGSLVMPERIFDLTLTVAEQSDKPGLSEPVTVTVELTENYRFYLTASLGDYSMYAELVNIGVPKIQVGQEACNSISWRLSQITKQEGDRVNGT